MHFHTKISKTWALREFLNGGFVSQNCIMNSIFSQVVIIVQQTDDFWSKWAKTGPILEFCWNFPGVLKRIPGVKFSKYTDSLRGGLRSIFTFLLFLIEENGSYREFFSEWKNIVPSQSYWIFKSQKYIQLHCARELKSRFPENQL